MSNRELKIRLTGDNSGIKAAAAESVESLKKVDTAAGGVGQAMGRARDATGKFTAGVKEAGEAGEAAGKRGSMSFTELASAISVVKQGFGPLISLAHEYGAAMEAAAAKRREITKSFTDERDRLRGLATVMDTVANTEFTKKQSAFRAATGLTSNEALGYREGFQNAAAAFKGTRISAAGHEAAELQGAKLSAVLGLPPEEMGEMMGNVVGFRDRTKMTDEEAAADVRSKAFGAEMLLQHGKGNPAVMTRQFNMTSASALNEDAMKGSFQTENQVATAVSIAAEKHDAQAAEMVKAALRVYRNFDDKQTKPLLEGAGVGREDTFESATRKIADFVGKEAAAGPAGTKTTDVLAKYIPEHLGREAVEVFANKVALFDERANYAKAFEGTAPSQAAIDKAEADADQGLQLRKAEEAKAQHEAQRGALDARMATLRAQANAENEDPTIGAPTGTMERWFGNQATRFTSFGLGDPERIRQEQRMAHILARRGRAVGLDMTPLVDDFPETAKADLQAMIDKITAAGGDPYRDLTKEQMEEFKKQTALLQAIAKAVTPAGTPPPMPLGRELPKRP
jgi:hypothetical protein